MTKTKKQFFNWQDSEQISIAAAKSNTFTMCLINLGLNPHPSRIGILRKYLDLHKINFSHFNYTNFIKLHLKKLQQNNTIPDEHVLIKNSIVSAKKLRQLIFNKKLLPYNCSQCMNQGEWQHNPLTLQLDHINGDHQDNRIENMRWLCPNCHSQTPTFTGRKHKKNKIKKPQYITPISIQYPEIPILIEKLINSTFSNISKELNCSDNAIRKHLKRNGINPKNLSPIKE